MISVRAVLHPVHSPGLSQRLRTIPGFHLETPNDTDQLVEILSDGVPVLLTYRWEDCYLTSSLEWVQAISAGTDQFPVDEFRKAGVTLTSARGAHSPAVAEHAVALLLALVRGIGPAIRKTARQVWEPEMASEVSGRVAVIAGLGSIGSEIAQRLRSLGMRVIGIRSRPHLPSEVSEILVGPNQIEWACERADALVCCLPAGPSTEGLIGASELEALGEGWLVNVGRGLTVNEPALVEALTKGPLRGAALDVTATEPPPPDSPLWNLENVILTPHMAWASDRLADRLGAILEANLVAYMNGDPWLNRVT